MPSTCPAGSSFPEGSRPSLPALGIASSRPARQGQAQPEKPGPHLPCTRGREAPTGSPQQQRARGRGSAPATGVAASRRAAPPGPQARGSPAGPGSHRCRPWTPPEGQAGQGFRDVSLPPSSRPPRHWAEWAPSCLPSAQRAPWSTLLCCFPGPQFPPGRSVVPTGDCAGEGTGGQRCPGDLERAAGGSRKPWAACLGSGLSTWCAAGTSLDTQLPAPIPSTQVWPG